MEVVTSTCRFRLVCIGYGEKRGYFLTLLLLLTLLFYFQATLTPQEFQKKKNLKFNMHRLCLYTIYTQRYTHQILLLLLETTT